MSVLQQNLSMVWRQAQSEWQTSQRLQVISLVCLLIFLMLCHVQLDRVRQDLRTTAARLEAEYVDKKAVASDDSWPVRQKQASAQINRTDLMFWRAGSEGEALAKVRDFVQFMAMAAGLDVERISVDILAMDNTGYHRVHVDLRGDYKAGVWHEFVNNIMVARPLLLVESEQIDLRRARERYRLGLVAWVVLEETVDANG